MRCRKSALGTGQIHRIEKSPQICRCDYKPRTLSFVTCCHVSLAVSYRRSVLFFPLLLILLLSDLNPTFAQVNGTQDTGFQNNGPQGTNFQENEFQDSVYQNNHFQDSISQDNETQELLSSIESIDEISDETANGWTPVPQLLDILTLNTAQCSANFLGRAGDRKQENDCMAEPGRVSQLNETALMDLLNSLKMGTGKLGSAYVAVLYYATWCPFSRDLLPTYETLAQLHPSIRHVAVEERIVRPSVLSRVGVHSFPALFLHNRTTRLRYQGPRTLPLLHQFYTNVTRVKLEGLEKEGLDHHPSRNRQIEKVREPCPYPWAQHPEQILHENGCLLFAYLFVALRIVIWAALKIGKWAKSRWQARISRNDVLNSR